MNADDFGHLEGDAFTVKLKVFSVSPRTEEDFETVLQAMCAVGLIRFYEVGGDRYLEVVNFDREQPGLHKRTKPDYPDPPEDFGKFQEIPGTSADPREFPGRTEPNRNEQTRNSTAADAAPSRSPEVLVEIYKTENHRYLKSLERWHLTPGQWEQLSDCAVLRFARFPSIAELHEIACELQHQSQIKANSDWIAEMRNEWNRHQTEEHGDDSACSGLRASK